MRLTRFISGLFFALAVFATQANDVLNDYARHAQFLEVQISPDGAFLAATSRQEGGTIRLSVIDMNNMQIKSVTELTGGDSIGQFLWASNDQIIIYLAREIGALESAVPTGELMMVNADGSNRRVLTGFRSRHQARTLSSVIHTLPEDPRVVLISSFDFQSREPFLDILQMRIDTGRQRRVDRVPLRARRGSGGVGVLLDSDGEARLAYGIDPGETNEIVLMSKPQGARQWSEIARFEDLEGMFSPIALLSSSQVIGLSDTTTDTRALAIMDIRSGEHEVIAVHPDTDLMPIIAREAGADGEIIGASFEYEAIDAFFLEDVRNQDFSNLVQSLRATFPGQAVGLRSSSRDGRLNVVSVQSANQAARFFLFNRETNQLTSIAESRPWLNEREIPSTQIITYKARDGQEIQALLTLPVGASEDLPLVLLPHGGPHGIRDTFTQMDTDAKVLAEHGYAVLQPNFRGSGGFGRNFQAAGYQNWGTLMIDDMTDGVKHLIDQGIANKDRMCVYGASYGGYAALMSAIREPDMYQCAIGFVGVYDMDLMFTDGDVPRNQSGVTFLNRVLGTDADKRREQSPVHRIADLKAPVFIIHGARDQRAPISHANRLREVLEEKEHPYEWMVKEDEGHGFFKPANNIERWERMLAFLNEHIGE
ncbi:MAG: S9 family peptidase [Idiomarina sp.]|nr:S9 family peptidase [Idiomarina sp.]